MKHHKTWEEIDLSQYKAFALGFIFTIFVSYLKKTNSNCGRTIEGPASIMPKQMAYVLPKRCSSSYHTRVRSSDTDMIGLPGE
jgi:hypothetical protein